MVNRSPLLMASRLTWRIPSSSARRAASVVLPAPGAPLTKTSSGRQYSDIDALLQRRRSCGRLADRLDGVRESSVSGARWRLAPLDAVSHLALRYPRTASSQ